MGTSWVRQALASLRGVSRQHLYSRDPLSGVNPDKKKKKNARCSQRM